jgi:hypothetical protein
MEENSFSESDEEVFIELTVRQRLARRSRDPVHI